MLTVLLLAAYVGGIIVTIALATGAAALLAGFTTGLGQFMLVAAGWLAVVSVSPEIAEHGTTRLAEIEFAQRAPRSTRAEHTVVSYFVVEVIVPGQPEPGVRPLSDTFPFQRERGMYGVFPLQGLRLGSQRDIQNDKRQTHSYQ